jgi:hypothetical protein
MTTEFHTYNGVFTASVAVATILDKNQLMRSPLLELQLVSTFNFRFTFFVYQIFHVFYMVV